MAVESVVPVTGISALPRTHHAVLLAVHAWARARTSRQPQGTLSTWRPPVRDVGPPRGCSLASAWGVERIWRTTAAAVDALSSALGLGGRCASGPAILVTFGSGPSSRRILGAGSQRSRPSRFGRAALMALRAMESDVRPNAEGRIGRRRSSERAGRSGTRSRVARGTIGRSRALPPGSD